MHFLLELVINFIGEVIIDTIFRRILGGLFHIIVKIIKTIFLLGKIFFKKL